MGCSQKTGEQVGYAWRNSLPFIRAIAASRNAATSSNVVSEDP